jgi:hypothetical protein
MNQPQLTPTAEAAINKIRALRKYTVPATEKAVQRILTSLSVKDLITDTLELQNSLAGAQ